MKKTLIIIVLALVYFSSIAQELEVLGNVQANSIKLLNGAANNKILISDADGDATWGDAPSRKRSIIVTPGMINNLYGGATRGSIVWFETIEFPDVGTPGLGMTIPLPEDYKGGNLTIKVLYTNSSNTGNVRLPLGIKGLALGGNLAENIGGSITLSPPTTADYLASGERVQGVNNLLATDSKIIALHAQRQSADASDTSTGILKILGFVISYDD